MATASSETIRVTTRKKVVIELFKTERDYINDLGIITKLYKKPLEDAGLISEEQAKILFANVDQLPAINQNLFINKMNKKMDEAEAQKKDVGNIVLGDLFIELFLKENLDKYTEYCVNQPQALSMLAQLGKNDSDFASYLKNLQDNEPQVRGLSLGSYIIKPVQRLCKYPLLIRELMAQTDQNDEEYKRLSDAAEKVGEAVKHVNEVQRKADEEAAIRIAEIQELAQKIDGADSLGLTETDANRFLSTSRGMSHIVTTYVVIVRTGEVQRVKKAGKILPRSMFLFNSQILVLSPKGDISAAKKSKYIFEVDWHAKIIDAAIIDVSDSEAAGILHGFQLANRAGKKDDMSITLLAKDLEDKRAWINEIKKYIKMYQRQEARRRKIQASPSSSELGPSPAAAGSPDKRDTVMARAVTQRGPNFGTIQPEVGGKRRSNSDAQSIDGKESKPTKNVLSFFGVKAKEDRGSSKKPEVRKDEKSLMMADSLGGETDDISPRPTKNDASEGLQKGSEIAKSTQSGSFQPAKKPSGAADSVEKSSEPFIGERSSSDSKPPPQSRTLPGGKPAPPAESPPVPTASAPDSSIDPTPAQPSSSTLNALISPRQVAPTTSGMLKSQSQTYIRPTAARPPSSVAAPNSFGSRPKLGASASTPSLSTSSPAPSTSSSQPSPSLSPVSNGITKSISPPPSSTSPETPPAAGTIAVRRPLPSSAPRSTVMDPSDYTDRGNTTFQRSLPAASPKPPPPTGERPAGPNPLVLIDALIRLAADGNLERAKDLMERHSPNVNGYNSDRRTALHLASSFGHLEVVKFLISKGANPSSVDRYDRLPINDAQHFGHTHIVDYLNSLLPQSPPSSPRAQLPTPQSRQSPTVVKPPSGTYSSAKPPAPNRVVVSPPVRQGSDRKLPLMPVTTPGQRPRGRSRSFGGSDIPPETANVEATDGEPKKQYHNSRSNPRPQLQRILSEPREAVPAPIAMAQPEEVFQSGKDGW